MSELAGRPQHLQRPQQRVGIVGAGRVGSALGAAMIRAGHEVVATSAVSQASRERARTMMPDVPILPPDEVIAGSSFVFLTVPDDALRALVAGLANADVWRSGQIVIHTSGAQGVNALDPASARGVVALALHPLMTFAGRPEDVDRLEGVTWAVTTDVELRPVGEAVVYDLGGEPVWVPESARPAYHAALTLGSNHLITIVNDSMTLLEAAGVATSAQLIAPLLSVSLDNALRLGDRALTGPVSRGDVATLTAHLRALDHLAPEIRASYVAMALRTAERARAADRLSDEQFLAVVEVLR